MLLGFTWPVRPFAPLLEFDKPQQKPPHYPPPLKITGKNNKVPGSMPRRSQSLGLVQKVIVAVGSGIGVIVGVEVGVGVLVGVGGIGVIVGVEVGGIMIWIVVCAVPPGQTTDTT